MLDLYKKTVEGKLYVFRVVFPTRRDSATCQGMGEPGQPVKIRDGTVPVFISLSLPVPRDKNGKSRKGHSKKGIGRSKTEKDVLKQERIVLIRKIF